ncbi:hypothetical protein JTZ10_11005 [Gordonia rubripertincta]|uniref:DUF35 domain-containing protein n=1 Tax=Gordonia rubripertincta TaxID=36822 RepID=A0AAW4G577_GORRU|nr:hypothetical protein [Gordonia rubripertincta]MBM7278291.1 hypothetical protein [Gordonia rubripertincta]
MSAYNAGIRAARAELAERAEASGDDKRLLAAQMLHTMTLRDDDDFERGYRDELANVLKRWCRHCGQVFAVPNYWRCCPACLPAEYADGEDYTILDGARTVTVSDQWELHTLVGPQGRETLWLFDTTHDDDKCPGRAAPPHEQLGKLPPEFAARARRTRCGRMTRSGKPCRNGPWCKVHRLP